MTNLRWNQYAWKIVDSAEDKVEPLTYPGSVIYEEAT